MYKVYRNVYRLIVKIIIEPTKVSRKKAAHDQKLRQKKSNDQRRMENTLGSI